MPVSQRCTVARDRSPSHATPAMNKLAPKAIYGALIVALCAWVLHGFVHALLAASVTAIASWPLYARFSARLGARLRPGVASALFTSAITVFVLAPMLFAFWALLAEARTLAQEIVTADQQGIVAPPWLADVPLVGPWAAAHWQGELAEPGALLVWAQRTDTKAFVGWAQSMGQFAGRHALIMLFTVLLLLFLYQEGESLARDIRRLLREGIGERAERYLAVLTRAVRAAVSSMLIVGLFDGVVIGVSYWIAGTPRAAQWGAIIGALATIPFLGYAAVGALALRLAIEGRAALGLFALALGCVVLLCGDKIVRPAVSRKGVRLHFVWVLMGCLGGFEVLGLVGLVVGPVVLALARELWDERLRELGRPHAAAIPLFIDPNLQSSCPRPIPSRTTSDVS
jgi:predicted PurR-regulated permease PerM